MNKAKREVMRMTDRQAQMFLEAIKVIAEKSESKDEYLKALDRIQTQGIKKPQQPTTETGDREGTPPERSNYKAQWLKKSRRKKSS